MLLRALEDQCLERSQFECILIMEEPGDMAADLARRFSRSLNLSTLQCSSALDASLLRARACNGASGEFLALLAADRIPMPKWLSGLVDPMVGAPIDAIVGSTSCIPLSYSGGDPLEAVANLLGVGSSELLGDEFQTNLSRLCTRGAPCQHLDRALGDQFGLYLSLGTDALVRKESFEAVGGFYPLLCRGQGVDLGIRMAEQGHIIRASSTSRACHVFLPNGSETGWTSAERTALLYHHPYRSLAMAFGVSRPALSLPPVPDDRVAPCRLSTSDLRQIPAVSDEWDEFLGMASPRQLPGTF